MNKVFEKIIEKLEEQIMIEEDIAKEESDGHPITHQYAANCMKVIEKFVKQEAEQYNKGWILCDKEMPKENESIFARFKGTDKWSNGMFERISDEVIVTVIDKYGNTKTVHAHTLDGKWSCDLLNIKKSCQVIAWQPLPHPYQPKGE